MDIESFLRNCYDPVTLGFYPPGSETYTEEIHINSNNINRQIKYQ